MPTESRITSTSSRKDDRKPDDADHPALCTGVKKRKNVIHVYRSGSISEICTFRI